MDDMTYKKHLESTLEAIEELVECLEVANRNASKLKLVEVTLEVLALKHKVITDMHKHSKI